jgi:hypothetical protein
VLQRENIQTLDRLRANADRLEQFDGLGVGMAQMIRLALAYVAPLGEPTSSPKQYDSWGA